MTVPWIEIDSSFLSNFDTNLKTKLFKKLLDIVKNEISNIKHSNIEEFLDDSNRSFFFMLCPYCNNIALLSTAKLPSKPFVCVICGETNQYNKIMQSMEKAKILYMIAKENDIDEKVRRTLLEQSLVTIATGLEVFLRDIYSTTLNIKYVQQHKSLIYRFYNDTKTDFLNIGKAEKKYNKDLNIDLKNIIGIKSFKKINLLMLKRNVIVHNIGIVDNTFLEQSGLKCNLKDYIPIEKKEIEEYISIIEEFVDKIGELFQEEFEREMLQRIEAFLQE